MKKKIYTLLGLILIIATTLAILPFISRKQKEIQPDVTSTTPKNNSVFVNEKAEVIITLNRNILPEEGSLLKIKIIPDEQVKIVYQENKIRISPETSFKINTTYKIEVIYKEKVIYTLVFETTPFTPEQIQEEGAKQTAADLDYNEAYKDFLTKFPWYPSLPIEKIEYRVVYDFEKESFRIRLKIPVQNEEQKINIISRALEDLKKIGVPQPIKSYALDYQPQP